MSADKPTAAAAAAASCSQPSEGKTSQGIKSSLQSRSIQQQQNRIIQLLQGSKYQFALSGNAFSPSPLLFYINGPSITSQSSPSPSNQTHISFDRYRQSPYSPDWNNNTPLPSDDTPTSLELEFAQKQKSIQKTKLKRRERCSSLKTILFLVFLFPLLQLIWIPPPANPKLLSRKRFISSEKTIVIYHRKSSFSV